MGRWVLNWLGRVGQKAEHRLLDRLLKRVMKVQVDDAVKMQRLAQEICRLADGVLFREKGQHLFGVQLMYRELRDQDSYGVELTVMTTRDMGVLLEMVDQMIADDRGDHL